MKNNILFYIVVPVFKAELFINKCVNSVLNQTYSNWRLILIDDGTPDKSGEICDSFAVKNDKIHVIHQENKGQIAARMAGIKHILANKIFNSYVCFLDSDDTYEPYALQTIYDSICKYNVDMVIFNLRRVNNSSVIREKSIYNGVVSNKGELYKIVLLNPSYNSLCLKAVSINLIANIDYSSFFHIRQAEDLLQSLHYYKHCKRVAFINSVLYNYTINITSITQSVCPYKYHFNTEIRNLVWDFLQKENVWNDKEMQDYANTMQRSIINEINKISYFNISTKKKIELFKTIEVDAYCKKIFSFPVNSFILRLFIARKYRMLISLMNLKNRISSLIKKGKLIDRV